MHNEGDLIQLAGVDHIASELCLLLECGGHQEDAIDIPESLIEKFLVVEMSTDDADIAGEFGEVLTLALVGIATDAADFGEAIRFDERLHGCASLTTSAANHRDSLFI